MRKQLRQAIWAACLAPLSLANLAQGDKVLYRYEGDVLPYDESAGWRINNPCEEPCSESLSEGHFVLHWSRPADVALYAFDIARSPQQPPPTLWVEWHFLSTRPLEPNFFTCDARFFVTYGSMSELVNMYGDAAISFSGDDVIFGLEVGRLHTYRFESLNGLDYRISVDGVPFIVAWDDNPRTVHSIGMRGGGGCQMPPVETTNEWDFVRYGTISYGEKIVGSDPPAGFLPAEDFPALDRFTVRFEEPNYAYVDEITVVAYDADGNGATRQQGNEQSVGWAVPTDSSHPNRDTTVPYPNRGAAFPYPDRDGGADSHEATEPRSHEVQSEPRTEVRGSSSAPAIGNWQSEIGNSPPQVIATRRLDNGPPDVVEIVLDKPIPTDARTVFTFNDGAITQTVAYTYIHGDANADGRFDLRDAAQLQNCFLDEFAEGQCWAFDFDHTDFISLEDFGSFRLLLTGPN